MNLTLSGALPYVMEPAPEARWIAETLGGDPEAFACLVRLHQRRVFRVAGRFFRDRADVEDAAQDTFLIAWRELATYRGAAPFESWLSRICHNVCCRLIKARPPAELPLDACLPGSNPSPDAALEVERLLKALPPVDRFILLLLEGEGWSVAEIAERLGWTRVNVKVRAHRARRKLRRLLESGGRP